MLCDSHCLLGHALQTALFPSPPPSHSAAFVGTACSDKQTDKHPHTHTQDHQVSLPRASARSPTQTGAVEPSPSPETSTQLGTHLAQAHLLPTRKTSAKQPLASQHPSQKIPKFTHSQDFNQNRDHPLIESLSIRITESFPFTHANWVSPKTTTNIRTCSGLRHGAAGKDVRGQSMQHAACRGGGLFYTHAWVA